MDDAVGTIAPLDPEMLSSVAATSQDDVWAVGWRSGSLSAPTSAALARLLPGHLRPRRTVAPGTLLARHSRLEPVRCALTAEH